MNIIPKSIVKVQVKDKINPYLVTFADEKAGWYFGYRIFLGGRKFENEMLAIPSKFLGSRMMPGYVNVFNGGMTFSKDMIVSVDSIIEQKFYVSIIQGINLVLTGRYKITEEGYYRINARPILIDPMFLINSLIEIDRLSVETPAVEQAPISVDTDSDSIQPTVPSENDKAECAVEEVKDPKAVAEEPIEKTPKPLNIRSMLNYNLNVPDDDLIDGLLRIYKDFEGNDRLDMFFDLFGRKIGNNMVVNLGLLEKVFIYNEDYLGSPKRSFHVTKEQFKLLVFEKPAKLKDFKAVNGLGEEVKVNCIAQKTVLAKKLYYGINTIVQNSTHGKKSYEDLDRMIKDGANYKQILDYINSTKTDTNDYYRKRSYILKFFDRQSNPADEKKLLNLMEAQGQIGQAANYLASNIDKINVISIGAYEDNTYVGDWDYVRIVSIYASTKNEPFIKIGLELGEKAIDIEFIRPFILELAKNSKIYPRVIRKFLGVFSYNCSIITNVRYVVASTIISQKNKLDSLSKIITKDDLNSHDYKVMAACNISEERYLQAYNWVANNQKLINRKIEELYLKFFDRPIRKTRRGRRD